jgi:hypothetical protein
MKKLLFAAWVVVNVIYLFGYYAGLVASVWWTGLPFVVASGLAIIVTYFLRVALPRRRNKK